MKQARDLTGRRFGRLIVLERYPIGYEAPCGTKTPLWVCRCDCGCETIVQSRNLTTGRTRSCGCLRVENARLQGERRQNVKRYCKTFMCDHLGDRICCASCRYRRDCSNPCLNHPSRCGLEDLRRKETRTDDPRQEG